MAANNQQPSPSGPPTDNRNGPEPGEVTYPWHLLHNEPRPALTPDHGVRRAFAWLHGAGGSMT